MSDVIDSFTENCWLTLGKHEIQFWKCLQHLHFHSIQEIHSEAFHLLSAMDFELTITKAIERIQQTSMKLYTEILDCESQFVSVILHWNLGKLFVLPVSCFSRFGCFRKCPYLSVAGSVRVCFYSILVHSDEKLRIFQAASNYLL